MKAKRTLYKDKIIYNYIQMIDIIKYRNNLNLFNSK